MVRGGYGSANALALADRPVLLKGRGALDGGLVGAGGLVDIVCSSVSGHGPLLCGAAGRVVGAVGFDDVVLDERVGSPAVDSEVAIAIGIEGTRVVDDPER